MVKLYRIIQAKLDSIGMYRTVSGGLVLLSVISVVAGALGLLAYSAQAQLAALLSGVIVALALNIGLARIKHLPANHESAIITALILFFLTIPEASFLANWPLCAAITVAILSKFFLVYRQQHIVNPAAFGAVVLSLPGWYEFTWWVGNPTLFIPVLFLGAAVVHKVRKWPLVLAALGVGLMVFVVESVALFAIELDDAVEVYLLSWPMLFLAFFMLTEPFTLPPRRQQQVFYGALVGGLANTTLFKTLFVMSPELALVIGNLVVYPWRIRRKLMLRLDNVREVAKDIFEYTFSKPRDFTFAAGQYLEWMLPHEGIDSRGPRRYFTIASAPEDSFLRIALKQVPNGSSYKAALAALPTGKKVIASQLAGDFVLPRDVGTKLGFIAGGIGVTPFVSHLRHMQATNAAYDTALYYCSNTVAELAYADDFRAAATVLPLQYHEVIAEEEVSAPRAKGYVTVDLLRERTPDYKTRTWYISGPPPMVNAYKTLLLKAGVPHRRIKKDFFPGLA